MSDDVTRRVLQLAHVNRLVSSEDGATIYEIAEECGITVRNAYRLVNDLEELGIPLTRRKGLRPQFARRMVICRDSAVSGSFHDPLVNTYVTLNQEEASLLGYLLQIGSKSAVLKNRLEQLSQKLDETVDPRVLRRLKERSLSFSPQADITKQWRKTSFEVFNQLLDACLEHRICNISYARNEDVVESQLFPIAPLKVFERQGNLYVYALKDEGWKTLKEGDTVRADFPALRIYALERIFTLRPTADTYPSFQLNEIERLLEDPFGIILGDREFTARIWFSSSQSPYITELEQRKGVDFEYSNEDEVVLTVRTRGEYGLISWILGWGDGAKVLEPAWLREKVAATARSMAALYD